MTIGTVLFILFLSLWGLVLITPPVVVIVDRIGFGPPNSGAVTIGFLVFIEAWSAMSDGILRHEFCHIKQAKLLSPLFFWVVYFLSWVPVWVKTGDLWKGYETSVFEAWAQRASSDDKRPLPTYIRIDLSSEVDWLHSFWEEYQMDDNEQKPRGLEGSEDYRVYREAQDRDYGVWLKELKKAQKKSDNSSDNPKGT